MLPDRVIGERGNRSGYDEILFSSEEGVVAMVLQPLRGDAVPWRGWRGCMAHRNRHKVKWLAWGVWFGPRQASGSWIWKWRKG
jgi:hypothetical protein